MLKYSFIKRKKGDEKYGGAPCDLVMTDLSTHRQVIQYYYYLSHLNSNVDFWNIVQQIASALKTIWSTVNPRLPILTNECLSKKIKNLLSLVIYINLNNGKTYLKRNLDAKLDKLFDISTCMCSLDILPCMIEKSVQEHILCLYPKNTLEDLAYLCDQRSKTGSKLSSIDETSGKRDRRIRHEQHEHQESVELEGISEIELLMDSPEHPSNFSNNAGQDAFKQKKKASEDFSLLKLTQYNAELLRNKCSLNLGLTFANALLHDIKHLLRPEIDISHITINKGKLDWSKEQIKAFCEDSELCENTQFLCVLTDKKMEKKPVKYKEKQIPKEESVSKILPHMDISSTESSCFLDNNIKLEVEIKEEVVDDYFESSNEVFVQDMQEEYVSSLQNSPNSSCDVDSSSSMTENPWIDFDVLSETRKLFNDGTGFPLISPENSVPRRSRRCRKSLETMSPWTKYQRIRERNNEASSRYRAKKRMEREHLDQMFKKEQERNLLLKQEFNSLTKEYSKIEKMLKSKRISPSYSSD